MAEDKKKERVLVFGTFDNLHEGHINFLKQAESLGQLTVVVAPESAVFALKGRNPHLFLKERLQGISALNNGYRAIAGDEKQGSWDVLDKVKPNIIALGYDQDILKEEIDLELKKRNLSDSISVITLKPYKGDELHSRWLNRC